MSSLNSRVANPDSSPPLSPVAIEGPETDIGDKVVEVPGGDAPMPVETILSDDEGQAPRILPSPGQPSQRQRDQHSVCHIPFRSWCNHCVRGRGRDRQSRSIADGMKSADSTLPRIVMDYGFFSVNPLGKDCKKGESGSRVKITILVLKETQCGSIWSYTVAHKGGVLEPWVSKQIIHDLATVGIGNSERIGIKNDQESNIAALANEIARLRHNSAGTALDESRVSDSNSNATAEVAVQEAKGMVRTIRSALEERVGAAIPLDHPIVPWMVRFPGMNINRFQIRADGVTAYQHMKGFKGVLPLGEFGEVVHFRQHNALKLGDYVDRYEDGVWLGLDPRSGENIIGTSTGVYRSGSVRRKPPDMMWSKEMLDKIIGTPETLVPGKDSGRPPTYAMVEENATIVAPTTVYVSGPLPERQTRQLAIRRSDVLEHGPSERCVGCRCVMMGEKVTKPHSQACRARFEQIIQQTEDGQSRVARANERLTTAVVKESENIRQFEDRKRRREGGTPAGEAAAEVVQAADDSVPAQAAQDQMEIIAGGSKRRADFPPDDPRVEDNGEAQVEMCYDVPDNDDMTGGGADASASASADQNGGNVDDSAMDQLGLAEGSSQLLTMAAGTPLSEQDAMWHGTKPKPTNAWGRQSSGGTREPGQKSGIPDRSSQELQWRYIGSGIVARTFVDAKALLLTTRKGPAPSEIEWRTIRCVKTGRVLDDCRPEDTADSEITRVLKEPTTIRVELRLKSAAEMYIQKGPDVVEVFSPPRIVQEAGLRMYGGIHLKPGWSLDLTMKDPHTGKMWDFAQPDSRNRALKLVRECEPYMIIGSPPCTAFSHLQNLNKGRRDPKVIERELEEGRTYLRFMMSLYREQVMHGRYFLHEHPATASSWAEREVQALVCAPGVHVALCHMCRFGMEATDESGKGLVKKPTKFMTNSRAVFELLDVKCENTALPEELRHRHVQLMSGRARHAQIYPKALCQAVCLGIAAQKKADESELREVGMLDIEEMDDVAKNAYAMHSELGMDMVVPEEASASLHEKDGDMWATDDVTGEKLSPALVTEARAEEIKYFRSMGVYRKVSMAKCLEATGRRPIATRWIDINKGDKQAPKYRSRLVAKEFNDCKKPELFAATPPAEGLKLLLSRLAQSGGKKRLLYADVSRAYFYAPAVRPVYVIIPAEDREPDDPPDICGELAYSMYGTRDAAQNWAE